MSIYFYSIFFFFSANEDSGLGDTNRRFASQQSGCLMTVLGGRWYSENNKRSRDIAPLRPDAFTPTPLFRKIYDWILRWRSTNPNNVQFFFSNTTIGILRSAQMLTRCVTSGSVISLLYIFIIQLYSLFSTWSFMLCPRGILASRSSLSRRVRPRTNVINVPLPLSVARERKKKWTGRL